MAVNVKEASEKLVSNMSKAIKGKREQLEAVTAAVLAGGNILLEDVPGTGKTVLAKSLAKSVRCQFKRIQFTPDLLPSDITGINFFNMKSQEFVLKKGPVFTNILLADEINRAGPRTQSALLECMEEKHTTIDGEVMPLPKPFVVIATQNPVETAGTFPLPEAQLDRFLIRLSMGYGDRETELEILSEIGASHPVDGLESVIDGEELALCVKETAAVPVNGAVMGYLVDLAQASRCHEQIKLGLSTRGLLALKRMSQAFAAMEGAEFVTPAHVQRAARYVIPHRLVCRQRGAQAEITESILAAVAVPTEEI